ncbi:MAG TPA: ABC transporter permease [Thermoanaerobaculia bacterium]|nr:ABC transporter permease [Thermoanaerobaculia bacterium]
MERLLRDLRYALRVLGRRPMLTVAAVLCLALGIGSTTVVFSFVDAVLLRPLPYPEPDRVVMIWNHFLLRDLPEFFSSGEEFLDHRRDNRAFDEIAGVIPWDFNLTTDDGNPERIVGGRVSASLFEILGSDTLTGRVYDDEEESTQAAVVVLGHDLWQRRFGADPDVVGKTLALDGLPHEVIGVLRPDFRFPVISADLWVPFTPNPAVPRRARGVRLVGRIAAGQTPEQAQAELDRLARLWQQQYPDVYTEDSGFGIHLEPIREQIAGEVRPLLVALFAAVVLVLLIACANVANLLLAQAAARGKEISLRTALGAGRGLLTRQLLTESLLLGFAGGVVGVVFAFFGQRALVAMDVGEVPRLATVSLDLRVLGFAFLVSLVTGLLFGLAPAWSALKPNLVEALKEGGKAAVGDGRGPLRSALVVAEIALAVAVLVGAGMMLRSFQELSAVDPGFRTDGLLTAELAVSGRDYPPPRLVELVRRLDERLEAAPELRRAAFASLLPLERGPAGTPVVEGWDPGSAEATPLVAYQSVSPDYFEVLGLSVVDGRLFDTTDSDQSVPVAIVDRDLAELYWPGRSAVGRRVHLPGLMPPDATLQVVGVVDNLEIDGLTEAAERRIYRPYLQAPTRDLRVVVETAGPPLGGADALRQTVWAIDPQMPIARLQAMEEEVSSSISRPRVNAVLFAVFAAVALLLASIGVYGVMAYSVAQRTREIGVRMALGARRGGVLALVMKRGMLLAVAGVVAGLGLALLLGRLYASQLAEVTFGVSTTDLVTFVAVPAVLVLVALVACWLPARRATRIDPTEALRYE